MSRTPHGPQAFDKYYSDLFGDRWPLLRQALVERPATVAFSDGLLQPYYLDAASIAVARALGVCPGDRVLDLCAAPGGKTLVLMSGLAGRGSLVANERSATRRSRLHRVLAAHLDSGTRSLVRVTGHDATRWALYEPSSYDRILADVPCSSERHVIQSQADLVKWSPSRTKRLAGNAYAIACAASDSLKSGGTMVYSTCALSPLENDAVIERILQRADGRLKVQRPVRGDSLELGLEWESTEHGQHVLPDAGRGAGPMYFSILCK